ncbi:MAG: hypothetical protein ACR2NR_09370 [Solirubrobacteraceae bacterium]
MGSREKVDGSSPTPEQASVARTVACLSRELEALDSVSPAAELYEAFIAALEKVYPAQRSA